jgi:long-chain acyl-CoA synthetase
VREYSTPWEDGRPGPPSSTGSLTDDLLRHDREDPRRVLLSRRTGGSGEWRPVRAADFLDDVRRAAAGLLAAGVEAGDRVALLSKTRYEWTLLDYAIWYVGAVSVPIYDTASTEQVGWILADSGARVVVAETDQHADRVREAGAAHGGAPEIVWTLDPAAGEPAALAVLDGLGADRDPDDLERRRDAVGPDDVATLIYTSGTMGPPLGCVLTHRNLMVGVAAGRHELGELFEQDDAATLLVLPLAHVFARILQVAAVSAGVRLGHSSDIRRLTDDLQGFGATFVLGVPRIFERLFTVASQQAASEGHGRRFDRATDVAIAYSRSLDRGRVPPVLRGRQALADRLVFRELRAALGGRCRFVISGGAPLGERLGHFYRGIGVPLLEGYGLTETTGAVTTTGPGDIRVGSVGRPLPGTTVRVGEDGEVLVSGGQVMRCYWNAPEPTEAVFTPDGWLRTGDLGEIDDEGFLRITGRAKEILVTSGGKNVAPGLLEDRLRTHPLVGSCLVVGDGRPYVAALVTLDREGLSSWTAEHGRRRSAAALARDPEVRAEVQRAVDAANAAVSQAESIRRFEVLPVQWSEETGELTPSLKLRRNVLLRRYREDIEALYAG